MNNRNCYVTVQFPTFKNTVACPKRHWAIIKHFIHLVSPLWVDVEEEWPVTLPIQWIRPFYMLRHWFINTVYLPVAKMRQFCKEDSQFLHFLSPVDTALWSQPWSTGQEKEGPPCSAWGPFHSPASWVSHMLVHMTSQLFCLPWLRDKNPKDEERTREGFKNLLIINSSAIPSSAGLIIYLNSYSQPAFWPRSQLSSYWCCKSILLFYILWSV